jgi:regulator of protease activity HflC (stomatin/prohibitin superfamily)
MLKGSANVVSALILVLTAVGLVAALETGASIEMAVALVALGVYLSASPRVIQEWERGVLLRLGKFRRMLQPGMRWVIPGADSIVALVDMRIRSTSFAAEDALTKDTVPVNVDAVLFWVVTEAQRAILEVESYVPTISWAAQTTLRDVIGRAELVRMISDRAALDQELQVAIDAKTSEWGITVQSVEIRDVKIPAALEDAMSRKAQADREKEARVILAESETLVAERMVAAAQTYQRDKTALRLRAMNMTYESIKEKGALMVIPSGMSNSLDSGVLGVAASSFRTAETLEDEAE